MGLFFQEKVNQHNISEKGKEKLQERRATRAIFENDPKITGLKKKKIKVFTAAPKWWTKASIKYAFSHLHVTSRLEKLMASNLVCLTDRDYMQRLQERIIDDHADTIDKRILNRESTELERVKNLVLTGRIPLSQAPENMADHPIMIIEKHCRRLIARRRAKIKILKVHIPTHLYSDDTPDPPSGLSIENGHVFRKPTERVCVPVNHFLPHDHLPFYLTPEDLIEAEQETDEKEETRSETSDLMLPKEQEVEEEVEEIIDEYMFTSGEYNKLKYEKPLVKELRKCTTAEELYVLADELIIILESVPESSTKWEDDTMSISTQSSIGTLKLPSIASEAR